MRVLMLIPMALLFLGCPHPSEGPAHPVMGVNPDGTPKWAKKGSGAFDGKHGRAFYGVGLVSGIQSESLERQTADNRARGEIAKLFNTYIASMMKDYQRSTSANGASAEEQDVVSAQKTITEVTLRGVEIRDHWRDPQSKAMYALAILDLNAITRSVGQAKLAAPIRDYVRANADKAFNDLDKELGKRNDAPAPAAPAAPATPPPTADAPPPPPPPAAAPATPAKAKVGLKITGIDRATVQSCFAERLTKAGYELYEGTSDVHVMISGKLIYKRAGVSNGTYMVKAHANVRVRDVRNGRTILAVADRIKVGRGTLETSIQLAVSRLCDRIVPKIVGKIQTVVR